jgi:hypothetical protein
MKKYLFIIIIMLLVSCKAKAPITSKKPLEIKTETPTPEIVVEVPETKPLEQFVILDLSDVNSNQKTKAYHLGKRVLNTCNTSKFKSFSTSEAVQSVIDNTTEIRLTKTCLKFKLRYGDFIDLELQEVIKDNFSQEIIYRYKALYTKEIANKELQVSMNTKNQITALKSKDWDEKF